MFDKSKQEKIKKIIKEFFNKMTREESPEDIEIKDNVVSFEIETETPEILIGKEGKVLSNTQYLLSKILNKQIGEKIFVDFDVNQYKKKKTNYLKEMAKNAADEVSLTGREKVLPSMTPFERRIIHLTLSERKDIKTESEGQEPERRVVIKLAG